jgi:predicted  nucleic acid-binding Zn-ribbon protein
MEKERLQDELNKKNMEIDGLKKENEKLRGAVFDLKSKISGLRASAIRDLKEKAKLLGDMNNAEKKQDTLTAKLETYKKRHDSE